MKTSTAPVNAKPQSPAFYRCSVKLNLFRHVRSESVSSQIATVDGVYTWSCEKSKRKWRNWDRICGSGVFFSILSECTVQSSNQSTLMFQII